MDNKLKIIFVGMPDMALVCLTNLLEKKFNIVGVVPPKKTHETYSYFKQFVELRNLNLIDFESSCNEASCIEKIKALDADIGVVCSYNYKLSKEFLKTTKMGYINSHPSLLPNYRGAAPYFHIINNGEKKSGITLHFVDETFDTGDIICQKEFDLFPNETMGTLFNRTNFMISDGLIEILSKLENGEEINRIPQDKEGYYVDAPKVDGNFRIHWNKKIEELDCLIRASNPFYNAFAFFRGVNIKIIKAQIIKKEHNLHFGQVALANENEILIATRDGFLSLEVFQVGSWGIMTPKDFYYMFKPEVGEILV